MSDPSGDGTAGRDASDRCAADISSAVRSATPARRTAAFILFLAAVLLPTLTLIPLGGLYLYEHGYLLWWALGALVIVSITTALQRWALQPPRVVVQRSDAAPSETLATAGLDVSRADSAWTPVERQAWDDVLTIAARVDIDKLGDMQAVLDLGQRTVDTVARRLHPSKSDAMWRFTLPEALAISEQVSARLSNFVETRIPFGDRLTVAQFLAVYRWRDMIHSAEKAYAVWRLIRLANPVTAATHEARERLSGAMLSWGREQVTRRLVEAFVEEVGRAAIDLYGGRIGDRGRAGRDASASREGANAGVVGTPKIKVLVVGAGEQARIVHAALLQAFAHDEPGDSPPTPNARGSVDGPDNLPDRDNARGVRFTYDFQLSDAVRPGGVRRRQLRSEVLAADILIWVVPAVPGLSPAEAQALQSLREGSSRRPAYTQPLLLTVVTNPATDSVGDLVRHAGIFADSSPPPFAPTPTSSPIIAFSISERSEPRPEDVTRLHDQVSRLAAPARTARVARTAGPRRERTGIVAAGGQAISAVINLTRTMIKRS